MRERSKYDTMIGRNRRLAADLRRVYQELLDKDSWCREAKDCRIVALCGKCQFDEVGELAQLLQNLDESIRVLETISHKIEDTILWE